MHAGLKNDLLLLIPSLRAFAFCLVQNLSQADELLSASLTEIWSGYDAGKRVDLEVASFRIVHRQFLRRGSVGRIPSTPPGNRLLPTAGEPFASRFARLPRAEREAVSLVELWHFDPDQAARICDCDRDTIMHRVAMARRHLEQGPSSPVIGMQGAKDVSPAYRSGGRHAAADAFRPTDRG